MTLQVFLYSDVLSIAYGSFFRFDEYLSACRFHSLEIIYDI